MHRNCNAQKLWDSAMSSQWPCPLERSSSIETLFINGVVSHEAILFVKFRGSVVAGVRSISMTYPPFQNYAVF